MSRFRIACTRPKRRRFRHGLVALMLIVILTLLVGTFAISISHGALHEARDGSQQASIRLLESAVFTARQSALSPGERVRLPVDERTNRFVVVEAIDQSNGEVDYVATLWRNEQSLLAIRRTRDSVP